MGFDGQVISGGVQCVGEPKHVAFHYSASTCLKCFCMSTFPYSLVCAYTYLWCMCVLCLYLLWCLHLYMFVHMSIGLMFHIYHKTFHHYH